MKVQKCNLNVLALCICLLHLVPFYILITTSFKSSSNFSSMWKLPSSFQFDNFITAWNQASLGTALFNSAFITFFSAVLLIVCGSLAAYPLARKNTKLNKFMYFLFVGVMVIPPLSVLVPLYQMVVDAGLLNTRLIAVLNNTAAFLSMTIFLYTGFIRSTVPKELEEAARIDGAGTLTIFFRVVFPLLKPITATVLIICCVYIWNDFQFALFFLQDENVQTLPVAINSFFGANSTNLHLVAAASIVALLPMTILFLVLQRYFIEGLAQGAVK
nr:carbohydrate ABC transporter permease [Salibacterium halotolerans]